MSRVWFITGSSRGLGLAITQAALEQGDRVIATARQPKQLENIVQQYPDRVHPIALDVSNYDNVISAVKEGHEKFGRIDVVVNNAGYADLSSVEDIDIKDFRAQIEVNLYGTVYVSKAVTPILRQQGSGHIFQISSVGGRISSVGLTAYQSAKWAIGGFSGGLAQELAPFGVKITVLEPGGMPTDWAGPSMKIPAVSEPYKATVGAFGEFLRSNSNGGPSKPSKVAGIILKLLDTPEPPPRLLVGPDAFEYGTGATQALLASDNKWKELSLSSV